MSSLRRPAAAMAAMPSGRGGRPAGGGGRAGGGPPGLPLVGGKNGGRIAEPPRPMRIMKKSIIEI